jgi:hypothetical protein
MAAMTPREILLRGKEELDPLLTPQGFYFEFRSEGPSSGGPFAWGEFVRGDRRLELHFRDSLGLVRLYKAIKFPDHMTPSERRMVDIATEKARTRPWWKFI